jgi:hypothetical protein
VINNLFNIKILFVKHCLGEKYVTRKSFNKWNLNDVSHICSKCYIIDNFETQNEKTHNKNFINRKAIKCQKRPSCEA